MALISWMNYSNSVWGLEFKSQMSHTVVLPIEPRAFIVSARDTTPQIHLRNENELTKSESTLLAATFQWQSKAFFPLAYKSVKTGVLCILPLSLLLHHKGWHAVLNVGRRCVEQHWVLLIPLQDLSWMSSAHSAVSDTFWILHTSVKTYWSSSNRCQRGKLKCHGPVHSSPLWCSTLFACCLLTPSEPGLSSAGGSRLRTQALCWPFLVLLLLTFCCSFIPSLVMPAWTSHTVPLKADLCLHVISYLLLDILQIFDETCRKYGNHFEKSTTD